jgi:hypothetical protein
LLLRIAHRLERVVDQLVSRAFVLEHVFFDGRALDQGCTKTVGQDRDEQLELFAGEAARVARNPDEARALVILALDTELSERFPGQLEQRTHVVAHAFAQVALHGPAEGRADGK